MPASQLVAHADLALLAHVDPDQLVDARRQLVTVVAVEHLDIDDLARLAVRNLQRGVAHLTRLLAEDGPEKTFFRGQLGLTLGRDLPDQHIAGRHLSTHPNDAQIVQVSQDLVRQVGDVPCDLFGPQLGISGVDLVLLDVDRRQDVVLDQALGQDDGVFEVVALPRHEGHEEVLTEGQLAVVGGRAVGQHLARPHPLAWSDPDLLVDAGVLVGPHVLEQRVDRRAGLPVVDRHRGAVDCRYRAVLEGQQHVRRVVGGAGLDTGADVRGLGLDKRHRLPLHVGSHEGTVGVVVLEERDQSGGHRHDLLR